MEYVEVTVLTESAGVEPVTAKLEGLGVGGFVIEDPQDFEEFLTRNTPRWDYVDEALLEKRRGAAKVKLYLPGNEQGAAQLADLRLRLAELQSADARGAFGAPGILGTLETALRRVDDGDWADCWKQYFKPFTVGERFLIKPSWEDCPDAGGRHVLEIDPGGAFGSGTHETTRLCIALLEETVRPGDRVLDMGCGSGILSIAALLGGAGEVTAVDVDEAAVAIAADNIRRNGFDRFTALQGDALADPGLAEALRARPYAVIAANIVADVLIAMAPLFAGACAPGGALIASGIIGQRAEEVRGALRAAGFGDFERRSENDWVAWRCRAGAAEQT